MTTYAEVILPVPLGTTFTYSLPADFADRVQIGCRLLVPFGRSKTHVGMVAGIHDQAPTDYEVRDAYSLMDETPILLPSQLRLWQWIADYYLCTLGEVYKAALPGKLKDEPKPRKRKNATAQLRNNEIAQLRNDAITQSRNHVIVPPLNPLSPAQQRAFDQIHATWQQHDVCLLHGVTSSGKTEVYIHLIQEYIAQGKQVLYLLPEIVLTTQLVERLRRVFGERLGVYHSKYTDADRVAVWQKQLSDEPYDIIVGVRSSIFLPFQHLGLVIVDEEHENSFKQEDPAPRYHARSTALVLARMMQAKTLLGTATPSIDTYYNCQTGKYGLVSLTERYQQVMLPEIQVVDIKEERRKKQMTGPFSSVLLAEMRRALESGEQVILFQNRRGYAPTVECHACGWVPRCPHCDISLTQHLSQGTMSCHYCGYRSPIPKTCPACEGHDLTSHGYGTERIEDDILRVFPDVKVGRMDLDTTRSRKAYEKLIADFQTGETQILVGTQMVTKGLDFDRVSLVGILDADTMLNQPDFRSYEHAFQMMAQVAGRAGRRNKQGIVLLQTKQPTLPVIQQVVRNDYAALYQETLDERTVFQFPPLCRLIYVYMKHRHEDVVNRLSIDLAALMRRVFADRVLGPEIPPVGRVQMMHIRKLVLKVEPTAPLPEVRRRLRQISDYISSLPDYRSAVIYFDADPV